MHMKGALGGRQTVMHNPGAQLPGQMFLTGSRFWEREENPSTRSSQVSPCTITEVGGANLTSQGIQHPRMVAQPDINPA